MIMPKREAAVSEKAALELMLEALYQRDRDDLAQRLTERFGSCEYVAIATADELKAVGLTERAAGFFGMFRRVCASSVLRDSFGVSVSSEKSALSFLTTLFRSTRASDCIVYVDRRGRVNGVDLSAVERTVKDTVGKIAGVDAYAVIAARRVFESSDERLRRLKMSELYKALHGMGRVMFDYFEFGRDGVYSAAAAVRGINGLTSDNASELPYDEEINFVFED